LFKSTKKHFLCATALAGLLCIGALPARAESAATVPGNVSAWALKATKIGTAADSRTVDIAVHMALRDPAGLKLTADSVSNPRSAEYGHYLSKHDVATRYAPDAADVAAVTAMLKNAGMTSVKEGPIGAYVQARATVGQLRAAFGVTQDLYRYGNLTLRANKEAPTIPASLAGKILYVEGLDDSTFLKHPFHQSATREEAKTQIASPAMAAPDLTSAALKPAVIAPPTSGNTPSPYCSTYFGDTQATLSTKPGPYKKTLPWLLCGYTPQQIQLAYGLNKVKPDGTGVKVAIIDAYASPTLEADGNRYAKNHALPALTASNFTQIIPEGIYNVSPSEACGPQGWFVEQSLDLASVHGSAPGASIVYIGARDCNESLTVALLDAIYNVEADVITNSYGYNGEAIDAASVSMLDQAAEVAATQGQTILFSSGDDGDLSQINGVASGAYEATSPYVTGVGGTSLALYGAGGNKGEWGWGNARDYLAGATVNSGSSITTSGLTTITDFGLTYYDFSFYSGSGGGISLIEPQPSYQVGVVPTALATTVNEASGYTVTLPTPQRVSPDVAMVADPYTGYLYGETFTIAGNYEDTGCTALTSTTEYCELDEGGTSLASPLMAGVMARLDQARMTAGKPAVGFANPLLYSLKPGATQKSAALVDVLAPTTPTAVLRGYVTSASLVRVVTINSVPEVIYPAPFALEVCGATICEGLNDVFNFTTAGYDDVTGLGTPYLPDLIKD
jgi:subtilase family serine protease